MKHFKVSKRFASFNVASSSKVITLSCFNCLRFKTTSHTICFALKVSSWSDVDPSLHNELVFSMTLPPSSPSTTTTPTTTTSFTTTTAGRDLALQDSSCEVGLDLQDCKANEECVPVQDKSRNGLCKCKEGFSRINNICTSGN